MSVQPVHTSSSSDAVIQTLKWARKQEFRPVPLRKQSKASIDEKYVDLNYSPPPDDLWHSRDLGVGVVTGPSYSGPVDIDVDCAEALFFARRLLPLTGAVFGRKSKPSSHYLYRVNVESLSKKAFNDPLAKSGTTIIEIRADGGHQTVFPGSIHEDTGEIIEWSDHAFPEVPRVDAAELERAVKMVAIAVLIVRHMWAEGQRNEVCKHIVGMLYYLEWTEEEIKLLISSIMEFTDDTDKTRLRTVSSTFRKAEKGGKITGSNTLRAFLGDAKVVDRIQEWAGSHFASLLQEYNERFAVVAIEGKFRVAETLALERGGVPVLFGKDDFLNVMATDTIEIDGKKVQKAKLWMASPRRRAYKSMDFIPGVDDNSAMLNLWTGWAVDPNPDNSCRAWLDLLYYTICGGEERLYNWMLHWFANIVREPQIKSLTAPVIIGRQGAGKSLALGYFGKILGPAYTTITNEEHIYGRFNKHLASTLLLHSEEALYGGDRKHRGIIKSLITDEYRIFEQKGVDAKRVRNYLRLALTSNETWAAPVEADDRRFTVIEMEQRKAPENIIKEVLVEMENGGPAALFDYLLNMEYDPTTARVNYKNDALVTLKLINMDPMLSWWHETLKSGQLLPDYLCWAQRPERTEWPQVVSSTALYMSMMLKLREQGQRYVPNTTQWSLVMNKLTGVRMERKQKFFTNPMSDEAPKEVKNLANKQYTICNMPDVITCREAFKTHIGQQLIWPEEPDEREKPIHSQF